MPSSRGPAACARRAGLCRASGTAAERQRAVDLLWIGAALAKRPVRSDEAHEEVEPVEALGRAFFDVWMAYLLPLAVLRPEGELVTYCS